MAVIVPVLVIVYGLVLWGLTFVFRKLRVPSKWAILVAFLAFAIGIGIWAALISEKDSSALVNLPAILLGDSIYDWSIHLFGDPYSSQAHYSIPWILRVPNVYVIASVKFWGILGILVQIFFNHRRKAATSSRKNGLSGKKSKEESL